MKHLILSLLIISASAFGMETAQIGNVGLGFVQIENTKGRPLCLLGNDLAMQSNVLRHILQAQAEPPFQLRGLQKNTVKLDVEKQPLCDLFKCISNPDYIDRLLATDYGIQYAYNNILPIFETLNFEDAIVNPLQKKINKTFHELELRNKKTFCSACCKIIDVKGEKLELSADQSWALTQCKTITNSYAATGITLDFSALSNNENLGFLNKEAIIKLLNVMAGSLAVKDISREVLTDILYAADYLEIPKRWRGAIAEEYLQKTHHLRWLSIASPNHSTNKARALAYDCQTYEKCLICEKSIKKNESQQTLSCGHTFHKSCANRRFEHTTACQICGTQIPEYERQPLTTKQKIMYCGSSFLNGVTDGTLGFLCRKYFSHSLGTINIVRFIALGTAMYNGMPGTVLLLPVPSSNAPLTEGELYGSSMSTAIQAVHDKSFEPIAYHAWETLFRMSVTKALRMLHRQAINLKSGYNYDEHNKDPKNQYLKWISRGSGSLAGYYVTSLISYYSLKAIMDRLKE